MIKINDVSKSFVNQAVLKGVSLNIDHETVGLLGANGAGKTTLLKCILNLLDFQGTICVAGFDVRSKTLEVKKRIGYIPQHFPLLSDISVAEAMRFMGKLRGASTKRQALLLEEYDLAQHQKKSVAALSGGMRQKLSIAIALLSDPEVLLLDEPTANLDAWATRDILKILESWKGKKSIILSSHRLEEVQSVAHRLVEIKNGTFSEPYIKAITTLKQGSVTCTP